MSDESWVTRPPAARTWASDRHPARAKDIRRDGPPVVLASLGTFRRPGVLRASAEPRPGGGEGDRVDQLLVTPQFRRADPSGTTTSPPEASQSSTATRALNRVSVIVGIDTAQPVLARHGTVRHGVGRAPASCGHGHEPRERRSVGAIPRPHREEDHVRFGELVKRTGKATVGLAVRAQFGHRRHPTAENLGDRGFDPAGSDTVLAKTSRWCGQEVAVAHVRRML